MAKLFSRIKCSRLQSTLTFRHSSEICHFELKFGFWEAISKDYFVKILKLALI